MRKIILLLVFIFNIFCVFSQKETKTVVTINGEQITVADFKRVYEKNLSAIDNEEAKDIEKNLNLLFPKDIIQICKTLKIENYKMEKNAMPFLHKYVGNPVLTFIGNLFLLRFIFH